MELLTFDRLDLVQPGDYVVIRFNGLFGDILHGMCRIQPILNSYPNHKWIIVHDYLSFDRVKVAMDLLSYWIDNGKIAYYFHYKNTNSARIPKDCSEKLNARGIPNDRIFDMYVFQNKPDIITLPQLGIEIPLKQPKKAVIFRYSGYHRHYPKRNRPEGEWSEIEKMLLNAGFTVYLLGKDDSMGNSNNVVDLRGTQTIKEVLEFSSNAQVCITVTTFLYLWQQFLCPTAVLADGADVITLRNYWQLHSNLDIINATDSTYLQAVGNFVTRNSK